MTKRISIKSENKYLPSEQIRIGTRIMLYNAYIVLSLYNNTSILEEHNKL